VFRVKSVVIERSGVRTVINENEAYLEVILDGEGLLPGQTTGREPSRSSTYGTVT